MMMSTGLLLCIVCGREEIDKGRMKDNAMQCNAREKNRIDIIIEIEKPEISLLGDRRYLGGSRQIGLHVQSRDNQAFQPSSKQRSTPLPSTIIKG